MMNDEQRGASDQPERITLTDLYGQLPTRLAEAEEPYDTEAGLADLLRWVDAQPHHGDRTVATGDRSCRVIEIFSPKSPPYLETETDEHRLPAQDPTKYGPTPEIAAKMLALEERRLELEESRARFDVARAELEHRETLERIRSAHQIAMERVHHQARLERQARVGRLVGRIAIPFSAVAVYAMAVLNNVAGVLGALGIVVGVYMLMLLVTTFYAVRPTSQRGQERAYLVLRLLLFQDPRPRGNGSSLPFDTPPPRADEEGDPHPINIHIRT